VVGQDGRTYPATRTLKNPATDKQLRYLANLCRQHGQDMPKPPISKARAAKLIDRLKDGPPVLDARPFIARLRKLVEDAEAAAPLGAEFVPAQPWVRRLAQVTSSGSTNGQRREVPPAGHRDDELQALVDSGVPQ
jgi:hypothetical protein